MSAFPFDIEVTPGREGDEGLVQVTVTSSQTAIVALLTAAEAEQYGRKLITAAALARALENEAYPPELRGDQIQADIDAGREFELTFTPEGRIRVTTPGSM